MSQIVTITFNPCIDKSATVAHFIPEKKLSCSEPRFEPGGGGVNVARAIKKLGGDATAIYPAGGYTGKFFNELLAKEKIQTIIIEIENPLRENVIMLEESSNSQFRFGFPGAKLLEHEWEKCLDSIVEITGAEFLVASGSLPEGVPDDIFARLATISKKKNLKLVVDTSKAALKHAANAGVYMLKPNLTELSLVLGKKRFKLNEITAAGKEIIARKYCEVLIVSLGEKGAMLFTKDKGLKVSSPKVEKKSTVGAGDSMVAGFVLSLSQGKTFEDALRYGVACGTAATMNPGTELCNKKDAETLFQKILVEKID
jgi:6-phosphofructokinase 2